MHCKLKFQLDSNSTEFQNHFQTLETKVRHFALLKYKRLAINTKWNIFWIVKNKLFVVFTIIFRTFDIFAIIQQSFYVFELWKTYFEYIFVNQTVGKHHRVSKIIVMLSIRWNREFQNNISNEIKLYHLIRLDLFSLKFQSLLPFIIEEKTHFHWIFRQNAQFIIFSRNNRKIDSCYHSGCYD